MRNVSLCIIIFLLSLTACQEEGVLYNKQVAIDDYTWNSSDRVSFNFNIQDTSKSYDLIFTIRTTDAYAWSSIYLFTEINAPDNSTPYIDTVQFIVADKYGNWLGENSGNTITNHFLYKRTQFPAKGDYELKIHQAMRDVSLEEVMDVGFKIEDSE